jgi:hypothetical protein
MAKLVCPSFQKAKLASEIKEAKKGNSPKSPSLPEYFVT